MPGWGRWFRRFRWVPVQSPVPCPMRAQCWVLLLWSWPLLCWPHAGCANGTPDDYGGVAGVVIAFRPWPAGCERQRPPPQQTPHPAPEGGKLFIVEQAGQPIREPLGLDVAVAGQVKAPSPARQHLARGWHFAVTHQQEQGPTDTGAAATLIRTKRVPGSPPELAREGRSGNQCAVGSRFPAMGWVTVEV